MTKQTLAGAPPSEEDMHGLPDELRAYLTFLQPKLAAIRDERHDPPIGDEAKGVFESLSKDAVGLEKVLQDFRM